TWTPVAGKSNVTFNATFPLGDFSGTADDVTGEFRADPTDLRQGVTGVLRVKAAALRPGDDGRDHPMRGGLAAERYPEIRFTVEHVDASFPSLTDRGDVLLTIKGLMFIHGVERAMVFPGRVRLRDDRLWVRGENSLKMSEFGMKPPSRLFVSVKDTVLVSFDITLSPQ